MSEQNLKNKKIWTILDLLQWGTIFFSDKKIESPRLNIELLVCSVLNIERIELYLQFDRPLKQDELSDLKQKVLKRADGYPLQYVIGHTNFFGCKIKLNEFGLIPRPETEILVDSVIKNTSKENKYRILDIGTGSGCIAIALAKHLPNSEIIAIDISKEAISLAKENSSLNNTKNAKFFQYDIFKGIEAKEKFDIIVSNPPYISKSEYLELDDTVKNYEPKIALTDESDGLQFYRLFSKYFPDLLKEEGRFYLEIGFSQSQDLINIFQTNKYNVDFIKDYSNIERVLVGNYTINIAK
ncbi:MAG TPA: peptide chain release factor N(5)-glutamine methyltransferase [Candidatus Kapabacteria bacterium]|nr:peptide chain release factor N(5)-glutamine methyltransferase [Candidatus Kapabacteria bacterium]HPO62628.1 peptide chain release factor N(5)-glutamine methyltransferase [Candidatus Kapabacteria bacterium]